MKTLFLSFVAFICMTTVSFGQVDASTATAQSAKDLAASKLSGNYLITLPSGLTSEDVTKSAQYYVHYFTVDYNAKTSEAKITMLTNDDKTRHVVVRFLSACGTQNVIVDNKSISTEDFFNTYLK